LAAKAVKKISQSDPAKVYFLSKSGIVIYPVGVNGKFYIEVNNNGNLKRYDKAVSQSEIDEATAKTVNYYYKLLKEKENGINKRNNNP